MQREALGTQTAISKTETLCLGFFRDQLKIHQSIVNLLLVLSLAENRMYCKGMCSSGSHRNSLENSKL
jgi:hypothetical protein